MNIGTIIWHYLQSKRRPLPDVNAPRTRDSGRNSPSEAETEDSGEKRVAVVFIHGIGIQDRYQQMVAFTKGLRFTPKSGEFYVSARGAGDTPQARFIPITITVNKRDDDHCDKEVDVHEIYWSPLLNGLTNWVSVLRWVGITAWRGVPGNRPNIPPRPYLAEQVNAGLSTGNTDFSMRGVRRDVLEKRQTQKTVSKKHKQKIKRTSGAKWLYEGSYLAGMTALVLIVLWWVFGALFLAIDQLSNPRFAIINSTAFRWEASDDARTDFQPDSRDVKEFIEHGPLWVANFVANQRRRLGTACDFWVQGPFYIRERETVLAEIAAYTASHPREFAPNQPVPFLSLRRTKGKTPIFLAGIVAPAIQFSRNTSPTMTGLSLNTTAILSKLEVRDLIVGAIYIFSLFWTLRYAFDIVALGWQIHKINKRRRSSPPPADKELKENHEEMFDEVRQLGITLLWRCMATAVLFLLTLEVAEMSKLIVTFLLIPLVASLLLRNAIKVGLTEIIGDVQIYVTRNENSQLFQGREAVLKRSLETLQEVLDSDQYDEVYLVGHSLGSVIGLDVLRRLYTGYALAYKPPVPGAVRDPHLAAYEKIKAFVTFGSPLEKTLLFFYKNDYKSYFEEFSRVVDWRIFDETSKNGTPPAPRPHCISWFNFWIWPDIVCDPLTSYPVTAHHQIQIPGHRNLWPHSDYWHDELFVRNVLRIFTWKQPDDFHRLELRGESSTPTASSLPIVSSPTPAITSPENDTLALSRFQTEPTRL